MIVFNSSINEWEYTPQSATGSVLITSTSYPKLTLRNTTPASADDEQATLHVDNDGSFTIAVVDDADAENPALKVLRTGTVIDQQLYRSDDFTWGNTSGTQRMILDSTGVGIGSVAPSVALDVTGDIRASLNLTSYVDADNYLAVASGGSIWRRITGSVGSGINLVAAAVYPANYLGAPVNGTIDLGGTSYRWKDGYFSGGVGIGIAPTYKLDVEQASDTIGISQTQTHATFSSTGHTIDVTRANDTAYSFALYRSGGTADTEFNFRGDGVAFADGSWTGGGADYSEYFESTTGQAIPFGKSVVIAFNTDSQSTLVREFDADLDEVDAIIGISRPKKHCKNATVIGNNAAMKWKDKYLTNDFGEYSYEPYTVIEWMDEDGKDHSYNADGFPGNVTNGVQVPDKYEEVVLQRRVLNPMYDPDMEYISAENRDEKVLIALLGQIAVLKGTVVKPTWTRCYQISEEVDLYYIR